MWMPMADHWITLLIYTILLEACVSNKKPGWSGSSRWWTINRVVLFVCVFRIHCAHSQPPFFDDDDDDTSTGSHRRFIHFLPCLLLKTHDNYNGKNMNETNVAAIGMHCLFTRFYCKRMFPRWSMRTIDTSIGSHRRVAHFLPCLPVKLRDNDHGKKMNEANVVAK